MPRILIVEDSPTQSLRLQLLLEQQGWEAICAFSAEEALTKIGRSPPDLILVDYYLPDCNGAQLVSKIRARQAQGSAVPIVGISVGGAAAADTLLAVGADFCVDKPFSVRSFFRTIEVLQ